ncbi:Rho GTPase-activating protein domain [Trinorchestia longiramus]|nr:Rho GTPase-activating protein domain [Trinorchestia longiramus]
MSSHHSPMEERSNCVEVRRKNNQHEADPSNRSFEDSNKCVSVVGENVRLSWNVAQPCKVSQNRMSSFGSSKNASVHASTLPGYCSKIPSQYSMEDLLSSDEHFQSLSATRSLGRNSSLPQSDPYPLGSKKTASSPRGAAGSQIKSSFLCHDCDPKIHKPNNRAVSVRRPATQEAKLLFARKVSNLPVGDPVSLKNMMLKELTEKTSQANARQALKTDERLNAKFGSEKVPLKYPNPENYCSSSRNEYPPSDNIEANLRVGHAQECITKPKFQEVSHDGFSSALQYPIKDSDPILTLHKHDRKICKLDQKEDPRSVNMKFSLPLHKNETGIRHSSFASIDEIAHLVEEKSVSDDIFKKMGETKTFQQLCSTSAQPSDTLQLSGHNVKDTGLINSQVPVGTSELNSLVTKLSGFHDTQAIEAGHCTCTEFSSKDCHHFREDCAYSPGVYSSSESANNSCCGTPSYDTAFKATHIDGSGHSGTHHDFFSPGPSECQVTRKVSPASQWEATSTDDGKIYFFNIETGDSNWELPEASARRLSMGGSGNTSDADEALLQSSPGTPTASPINKIVKQGFLMRTLYSREHKKVRKNWSSMLAMLMARVIDGFPSSGGSQLVSPPGPDSPPRSARYFFTFCKSAEDKKVRDEFELLEPVRVVVGAAKNKSSRSNILSLTNAAGTELLLRHDELSVIEDWLSVLRGLDIQLVYPSPPASPKKQHHKSGDKDKGMSDVSPVTTTTESLNNDQRTIRNKLLGFIKRRPTADALAKKGIIRDSVFGNTIAELCKQEKTKSPLFVLQCINAIEKKESNLKTDGLYRISGNAASIQKIRYEVEKNNYEVLFEEKEVNNLTGALKLFFRELKEPLLPYNCYERFIEWSEKSQRSGRHAGDLFEIVKLLPTENFETLKVLLRHLRRVCDYSADNRMNFMNMAIVFGPCLMWPKMTTGRDLMTDAVVQNMVVEGLLMHFE